MKKQLISEIKRMQQLAGILKEAMSVDSQGSLTTPPDSDEADRIKKDILNSPKKNAHNWALFQNAVESKLRGAVNVDAHFLVDTDEGMQDTIPMEFEEIVPFYVKAAKFWATNSFEKFKKDFEETEGVQLSTPEEVAELAVSTNPDELEGLGDLVPDGSPVATLKLHETAEFVVFESN